MLVEIIGPAGAGKTSLAYGLCQHNRNISIIEKPKPQRLKDLPFFASNSLTLLPAFLYGTGTNQGLTWREICQLIRLKGMHQRLRRRQKSHILIFDQGPIFELIQLAEFSCINFGAPRLKRWWQTIFQQWANQLDIVIWLDAPNPVLVSRISSRRKSHIVKASSFREASDYLIRYRSAYEHMIARLHQETHLDILAFDTEQHSLAQIARQVLGAIEEKMGRIAK